MIPADAERWSALAHFLGGYFNQHFHEIWGGPDEAVRAFQADEPVELQRSAASQARELNASIEDDEELQLGLAQLGSYYAPWRSGTDVRRWLEDLATTLEGEE